MEPKWSFGTDTMFKKTKFLEITSFLLQDYLQTK